MKVLLATAVAGTLLLAAAQCFAQAVPDNVGQPSTGMPAILQNVNFRPELNAQMPLDTAFTDENGKSVALTQYFHQQKPVLLAFVYYGCPMLCTQLEQGVVGSLRMLSFNPGRDYDVVFVSFDERDTVEMAAAKKSTAMEHFRRRETAAGWHFLTGSKESIAAVTNADGRVTITMPHPERSFRYAQNSWRPDGAGEYSGWFRMFGNARRWVE